MKTKTGVRYLKFWGVNPVWISINPDGTKSICGKVGFYKPSETSIRIPAEDLIELVSREISLNKINSIYKFGDNNNELNY